MISRKRLTGLDGLRGIAALFVLMYHAENFYAVELLFSRGYLAVDFFFMLSGYVMARTYEPDLKPLAFMQMRFWRLAPTMAVGAGIGFLAFMLMGEFLPLQLLATLVFVPFIGGGSIPFLLNRPTWSIFFELFANIAHAMVFRRYSIAMLCGVIVAMVLVLTFAATRGGFELFGARAETFVLGFVRVLMPYCIGIVLWRVFRDDRRSSPAIALLALPVTLAMMHWAGTGPVFDIVFIVALCPLFVLGGMGDLGRVAPVFSFLGVLSFPLYAVHYPILQLFRHFQLPMLSAVATSLLVGMLVMYIESLIRRRARKPAHLELAESSAT